MSVTEVKAIRKLIAVALVGIFLLVGLIWLATRKDKK